jgi:hypothetical protein
LMLTWKVQFCKSSWIPSHGGEVFRGIDEVLHMQKCLVTSLKILVKQLSTWSLVTAKVRVQGGTRSIPWHGRWCQPKEKYSSTLFISLQLERFEDVLLNICSTLCCWTSGLFGVQRPVFRLWRGWDKIVKLWKLWQSDK